MRERFRATGEAVAFFDTGGTVIGLFPWDQLAQDVDAAGPAAAQDLSRSTLAWNCASTEEVDAVLDFAISKGASLLKPAHKTDYGGYSGYFADPDNHPWEVVVAPGIEVGDDRRVHLPDCRRVAMHVDWRRLNNGNCPRFPVAPRRALAHDPGMIWDKSAKQTQSRPSCQRA